MKRTFAAAMFALLASCAPAPPTPAEIAMMQAAPKPSSEEAAEQAVKDYFAEVLFDAEAARYQFPLPPVQGSWTASNSAREFGWFMCGKINGKNRMGGYTGYKTFFAYFSPTQPDKVIDGTTADTDEFGIVDGWCKGLYHS
jgi:hypothetical protein